MLLSNISPGSFFNLGICFLLLNWFKVYYYDNGDNDGDSDCDIYGDKR